ncbi:MAG: hypothetical protein WDA16_08345 [Candidatus Thermoplasmatota archaeon]
MVEGFTQAGAVIPMAHAAARRQFVAPTLVVIRPEGHHENIGNVVEAKQDDDGVTLRTEAGDEICVPHATITAHDDLVHILYILVKPHRP